MPDLKETLENFKSASRPFQAVMDIAAALEPFANQERDLKEAQSSLAAAVDERDKAKKEAAALKQKADDYTNQVSEQAEQKANALVEQAQKTAADTLENAQKKRSAIENEQDALVLKAREELTELQDATERVSLHANDLNKKANEAEKRLAAAQAQIAKMLEG